MRSSQVGRQLYVCDTNFAFYVPSKKKKTTYVPRRLYHNDGKGQFTPNPRGNDRPVLVYGNAFGVFLTCWKPICLSWGQATRGFSLRKNRPLSKSESLPLPLSDPLGLRRYLQPQDGNRNLFFLFEVRNFPRILTGQAALGWI